ncbi:MAG: CPBP family intramembrane metalloprotease [Myxococcales bacterium]|nr:CPBP family intramembrane metalloprotease [Myxococcales bacterium]
MVVKLWTKLWSTYVIKVQRRTDAIAVSRRLHDESRTSHRREAIVILTILMGLFTLRFFGSVEWLDDWAAVFDALGLEQRSREMRQWFRSGPDAQFRGQLYWASARAIVYLVFPFLVVKLVLRRRLSDYGLRLPRLGPAVRDYGLMFLAILPVVVFVSKNRDFRLTYPFYRPAENEGLWPYFWAWEALYALQFVGLEFFYRGFMVHGLKDRMGYSAVYAMMIPYLMIHFGKPPAEALGSIIAGFVLGTLSLKTGSIWGGALLHVAVALTMDLLSLWHMGRLF